MAEVILRKFKCNKNRFPGPQPISIERVHFKILKSKKYVVSPKADGERNLLVIKDDVMALVNRAYEEKPIKLRCKKESKQGTILDVELIEGKILVFDAYQVNGQDVNMLPLNERLEHAEKFVKGVIKMTSDPIKIEMKPVFEMGDVEKAAAGKFEYETDGLIFTPVDEPIGWGTHETMFKWKPLKMNTIDFQVIPIRKQHDCMGYQEDGYDLCVQERGKLICEARLPLNYAPLSLIPILNHGAITPIIVECEYSEWYWKPIKFRPDKTYPNSRRTFYRTIVNLEEDIQWQEFRLLIKK